MPIAIWEYPKAIQYYEKGLQISSAIGDQSGIASNNGNLGNAYLSLGEYQKAIKYYEKGLANKQCHWRSIGNSKKEWQFRQCLSQFGRICKSN